MIDINLIESWQIERSGNAWVTTIRTIDGSASSYEGIGDADALLIAAAPELAEALKYIVENCRIFCADSMDCDDWALRDAIAALAKAGAT